MKNNFKLFILLISCVSFASNGYSQSKKEQIEKQELQIDSLNTEIKKLNTLIDSLEIVLKSSIAKQEKIAKKSRVSRRKFQASIKTLSKRIDSLSSVSSSPSIQNFHLNDLIRISKKKFGYKNENSEFDSYYGDIEHITSNSFNLVVGCGKCGDIVKAKLVKRNGFQNVFSIYEEREKKKIGELTIISDNHCKIWIDKCDEYGECCCGSAVEQDIVSDKSINISGSFSKWDKFSTSFKESIEKKDSELLKRLTSKDFFIGGTDTNYDRYFGSDIYNWNEIKKSLDTGTAINKVINDDCTQIRVGNENTIILIFENIDSEWKWKGILGD